MENKNTDNQNLSNEQLKAKFFQLTDQELKAIVYELIQVAGQHEKNILSLRKIMMDKQTKAIKKTVKSDSIINTY